jgi:hypothetical protein
MPRDAPKLDHEAGAWGKDIEYFCARCGHLVTRGQWELAMNGGHEHVFFNPAGIVFRIACFRDAPGAKAVGPASGVFSWFKGYLWRMGHCAGCDAHLGWRFEGAEQPQIFFGLIQSALTTLKG